MDEREREHLINRLQQYSGAPLPVPGGDAVTMELTKPTLERDADHPGAVTLRFEFRAVAVHWAEVFNREAGGPSWPPGLPIPSIEDDRIEVVGLPVGEVRRYTGALREHFSYTNGEVERLRAETEERQDDSGDAARRFDEEFDKARRFLNEQFGR